MRKYMFACLVSAAAAAAASLWLAEPHRELGAAAQEQTVPRGATTFPPRQLTGRDTVATGPIGDFTPEERVNIAVYEKVNRSVVNINTRGVRADGFFFFEVPSEGAGSGSVLDGKGHILTNFHVIEDARQISVTLYSGNSYQAEVVGADPPTDIAVLKLDAPEAELFPIELGNSTNLRVGQRVFAIGNPFGLERTLSIGIISSLNRSLRGRSGRQIKSLIQIDAAINPGNSGGPLLDSHGRCIGMNMAIASRTGESAGVGFSIPVSTMARVIPQLIDKGQVVRADIGISQLYPTEKGLLIVQLVEDGPAQRAGLRGPRIERRIARERPFVYRYQTVDRSAADTIVEIDGRPVRTRDALLSAVESRQPGDEVTVTVVRQHRQVEVTVRLGSDEGAGL